MEVFGLTDTGNVRHMNQDIFAEEAVEGARLLVVCDGMGGASAGEVASELACRTFLGVMREGGEATEKALCRRLRSAVSAAGAVVYARAGENLDYAGMGTTLVAAAVTDGFAVVANVGDSRAYHISGGKICRVTRDHSVIEDMIERGELTPEEARTHPNRNLITRALGAAELQRPDLFRVDLDAGDMLLLCSDGLSNVLSDEELLHETLSPDAAENICRRLVELTLSRGAPDNVTAVLLRY